MKIYRSSSNLEGQNLNKIHLFDLRNSILAKLQKNIKDSFLKVIADVVNLKYFFNFKI